MTTTTVEKQLLIDCLQFLSIIKMELAPELEHVSLHRICDTLVDDLKAAIEQ